MKKEKKEWFDEECKRELQSRRKLRLKMLQQGTEEAKNKFEEQRRKTKLMLRNKKRKHYEKVLEQIEENYTKNDIRNLHQGVKNERRGYQPKPVFYKDKDGKIIAGDDEVLERWKEYFKQLLNGDEINAQEIEEITVYGEEGKVLPAPSREEIKEIISKLKNSKSPGSDNLAAELFKYGGQGLTDQLQGLKPNVGEEIKARIMSRNNVKKAFLPKTLEKYRFSFKERVSRSTNAAAILEPDSFSARTVNLRFLILAERGITSWVLWEVCVKYKPRKKYTNGDKVTLYVQISASKIALVVNVVVAKSYINIDYNPFKDVVSYFKESQSSNFKIIGEKMIVGTNLITKLILNTIMAQLRKL
ncbi:hypothetical protein NQ315_013733 [Exocentrus adspersus]|uniref:Uncharacterized protein n=1 Tax=Exocentrus adspersus TaxID=1586481 RepID=A0AAV8W579_9CUCU|nr:hypothetical protein NQ315_013733 [Exocentrus adspersus]